ncbi:MAG: porin [bacterium]
MKKSIKTILMFGALLCTSAQAANWLALQGTEPGGSVGRAKVWGFIQPEYQSTDGTDIPAGPWAGQRAIFNQQRPDLKSDGGFNIIRARVGVRGTGFPLDSKTNYFILFEAGNNGITRGGGGSLKLTDASVTLSHIPNVKLRIGQFKTPGSEEGLQAIHVFDYINFTTVTNQMMLERFFDGDGSDTQDANRPNGPVGAFRDFGIQAFDIFKKGDWEHSYAFMVGNGNGITRGDNDGNREFYAYWSSELIYGGKGARRDELKMYAWYQDGKRTLTKAGAGEYDRTRWGIGSMYHKGKIRGAFEYMQGDGMIFTGSDGAAVPGSLNNAGTAVASFNVATNGKADGWYVHGGYQIMPNIELDMRYDQYNRVTNVSAAERQFTTLTFGAQYFFNKKTRLIANYELRDAEAPNLPGTAGPNKILGAMDNRISLQILAIF